MSRSTYILYVVLVAAVCTVAYAAAPQPPAPAAAASKQGELVIDEDTVPDSLVHSRWPIQRTTPITYDDLDQRTTDLPRPDNVKQETVYNDTLGRYVIGTRMGGTWLAAPVMMDMDEYNRWSERYLFSDYFRSKNSEIYKQKGKEKFDFTDMHFDLGPAEKIFGPGGIRVKTQGTAELKFGATLKSIDNPSLPIRNRKTTTMDFDEKININVTGKIGDKMKMNINYNTDATFDYDAQNMKLRYDGKEDEIIKLVEAGNIAFPSNSSLVQGASSLFGVRADMQFGKLKLQTVFSQKKSSSTSVASRGGVQLTPFELNVADYEENRHFFLDMYFHDNYDRWMATLPTALTSVTINRIEVWATNKSGTTANTRDIVAFPALGANAGGVPDNKVGTLYTDLTSGAYADARYADKVNAALEGKTLGGYVTMAGGNTYEKIEKARLLSPSEYTLNAAMGTLSLRTNLQADQVLAVAFEYTYNGQTHQVGEFSTDNTDVAQALFVRSLKNTNNSPQQPNWPLMMKNVYYLASSVKKEKFRLDIKYQSDTLGVYTTYMPGDLKKQPIIQLIGADRLDNNNRTNSNGYFDYVEGYTVQNGRVFLPKAEPFGESLIATLMAGGLPRQQAERLAYTELYTNTRTTAKQIADKNKYKITGQFQGSAAGVISLGAYNVPRGSVVVTAGGTTLTEGVDYSVNYSAGEVTIINQALLDAGTAINVSSESQSDFSMQRKTMFGVNWEYDFSKAFQLSGTVQHLSEQSLTSKVAMGMEPVNNTLVGLNMNWKQESQWLTNMLDKVPFLHVSQPSNIQFKAEFAKLFSSIASGTQDGASYIDDFENSTYGINLITPTSWQLASRPTRLGGTNSKTDLTAGYDRARLAWFAIDPLFTRRSSSLTPAHIKGNLDLLSNHYVREVYVNELYPNRDQSSYNGATATLQLLNLAYFPAERGPYNFSMSLTPQGRLPHPQQSWGGMMRKLDTSDFEEANIEYIEFWLLDPFIYTRPAGTARRHSGALVINLGEVSEDVLPDGRKFYESGMPVAPGDSVTTTQWGKIPVQNTITYAFATSAGAREKQDVGYNGLNDAEERAWPSYQPFLNYVQANVTSQGARDSILADPAADNYHYFRGGDWDNQRAGIIDRYKYINNPQGNSPDSDNRGEAYDTSYKTTPDVEDINQDYTLNEYEKYFEYRVAIDPDSLAVGSNYVVDVRDVSPTLRNGQREQVRWYKFRIPIRGGTRVGGMSDISSIRFMRMYLTNFQDTAQLRFASLDLVRGDWRVYDQRIAGASANPTAQFTASSVNIEEDNDRRPVNYVLPPGISRVVDPSQPQLVENNEQALRLDLTQMGPNDAVAVYKNTNIDMRRHRQLQMFVHAHALENNATRLQNGELAVFVRLGSDYNNNYYEYQIPLALTAPSSTYNTYSDNDRRAVWPAENMLNIPLARLTAAKKERNIQKAQGRASFSTPFTVYDSEAQNNAITVMGNPSIGEVRTVMIGVKNLSHSQKDGEVWINELRLLDPESGGGWAAAANLDVKLSDLGTVQASGKYISDGYGGIEQKVMERTQDKFATYSVTTNLELGKFFPDKAKVTIPFYYSVTKERTTPKYNPLDSDMPYDDAIDAAADQHERDSINSIAVTTTKNTNFAITGMRVGIATKGHPMPYDPANFAFSYSHSHRHTDGETTVFENEDDWRGALNYAWSPVFKPIEPFKNIKSKAKSYDILKRFAFNYLPQTVAFNTEMTRHYYELQERDLENLETGETVPKSFSSQFLWNRDFALRWDLTKNLHLNFQSATRAEIEEPYLYINPDLYPDQYAAAKDSVWQSIKHMGTPLDYNQSFQASYTLPLNLLPAFDWLQADASYDAAYHWARGAEENGVNRYGNTINNNRTTNLNGSLNLEKLYNHVPFLKKVNERFAKAPSRKQANKQPNNKTTKRQNDKTTKAAADSIAGQRRLKNTYTRELDIAADTSLVITHNRHTRRITVTAKDADGKPVPVKFRKIDDNKIRLINRADTSRHLRLAVVGQEPLDDKPWYRAAQTAARVAMMVRSAAITYRTQYGMTLPGFMPNAGDIFGQRSGYDHMAPGLGFAFGLTGDDFIDTARERGWLLANDSVATPAATTMTKDLQVRLTLEPVRNFKIDLNMSHTRTRAKSIQYMYDAMPTTESGSFTMTTISIGSAFESMGDAANGFHSDVFEKFCRSLPTYQQRVAERYTGTTYPYGDQIAGRQFDPTLTPVGQYTPDVMIPAFLNAYTGYGGMDIFPSFLHMLPNWQVRYSGLSQLPWFREHFRSVNINHGYKSIFAVGSYSSYSSFMRVMGDEIGFVQDTKTGNPQPSSMFNVSTVSINETFSPLLGVDVTLKNGLTLKAEYRSTRVLNLSMTSVQLNETQSKDWVFGAAYKINDFRFTRSRALKAARDRNRTGDDDAQNAKPKTGRQQKMDFAHDLNLRLDFSYRKQAALTRDIATMLSSATSGNNALKISFTADYSLSRLLTMSFYYDRQSNTPLLSSSSYPTVTQDFGLSLKFSLTR